VRGWLVVLGGCGRIAFDATGADAPSPGDAACTWTAFSQPAVITGAINSPSDDWVPTPTAGGLQMFIHTYRASALAELWAANRPTTAAVFGPAVRVDELVTGSSQQFDPTLSDDGLDLIYADNQPGLFHLFEAVRTQPTGMFAPPVELASVNDLATGNDWNPFLSSDGSRLVFSSSRTGGHDEIYETTRTTTGDTFAPPIRHNELSVANTEQWNPTLSADGLEIFFSSTRAGGPGGFDVYTAHRTALDQAFGAVELVPELSSARDDVGLRLSKDGTTMFLDYDAITAGGGNADIHVATRSCR
jgi:Tol biopolymer transport system component